MESKDLVIQPINFEEQDKNGNLNYETKVGVILNGKFVSTVDETGFMFHQFSQLAPKEIKNKDNLNKLDPDSLYGNPDSLYGNPDSLCGNPDSLYGNPDSLFGNPGSLYGP